MRHKRGNKGESIVKKLTILKKGQQKTDNYKIKKVEAPACSEAQGSSKRF